MKERTEKVGVEGGRSVRWTVPWPGVEAVGGKGEGIGAGGVIYVSFWCTRKSNSSRGRSIFVVF